MGDNSITRMYQPLSRAHIVKHCIRIQVKARCYGTNLFCPEGSLCVNECHLQHLQCSISITAHPFRDMRARRRLAGPHVRAQQCTADTSPSQHLRPALQEAVWSHTACGRSASSQSCTPATPLCCCCTTPSDWHIPQAAHQPTTVE